MSRRLATADSPGERARMTLCFCVLAGVGATIAGRLAMLQFFGHDAAVYRVAQSSSRSESTPAERCRIVDRGGVELAYDRPVYEARGEVYFAITTDCQLADPAAVDRLAADVAQAVEVDVEAAARYRDRAGGLRAGLEQRLLKGVTRRLDRLRAARFNAASAPAPKSVKVDFLIDSELSDAAAVLGLRKLDARRSKRRAPYRLYLHLARDYERVYAAPELTAGIVGLVQFRYGAAGRSRAGVGGIERLEIASPGASGEREFSVDARSVPYWTESGAAPAAATRIHVTLDLELQKRAQQHLTETAVRDVVTKYGTPPEWAALLAVDIETGGIRAMASFCQRGDGPGIDNDPAAAFAPTQFAFEPGSVVKPLIIAMGLQLGRVDWNREVDCSGLTLPVDGERASRRIYDSHRCGMLTPRGVLIQSSNIGAVRLGLQLGADGLEDCLQRYQLRAALGLPLPENGNRIMPRAPVPDLDLRDRQIWTGPSLCFGYGIQVTVAHLARAYLTLLSGRERELRLIEAIDSDGQRHRCAAPAATPRFLSGATVGKVAEAMVGLVDGEEGATARRLTEMLGRLGVPKGLIGGKTGTSEFPPGPGIKTRTASFVGFAPATAPRVLVVCVVQKKGAETFFGGSYAASAAGRLLLDALEREQSPNFDSSQVSGRRSKLTAWGRSAPKQQGR